MGVQTNIRIEKLAAGRVRVTGSEFFPISVEAPTREEAIQQFRDKVADDLAPNVEVSTITIDLPDRVHPLLKHAGDMRDDPLFDLWQEAIEEYRKELDVELEASFQALQTAGKP